MLQLHSLNVVCVSGSLCASVCVCVPVPSVCGAESIVDVDVAQFGQGGSEGVDLLLRCFGLRADRNRIQTEEEDPSFSHEQKLKKYAPNIENSGTGL